MVNPTHHAIYHWSASPLTLFLPVTLDFLLVWVLFTALLFTAQASRRSHKAVWLAILLFLPFVALKSWVFYRVEVPSHLLSRSLFFGGLAAYLLLTAFWRAQLDRPFERIVEFASTLLLFLGVSGAALLCQILWFGYQARGISFRDYQGRPQDDSVVGHQRFIWIIFDELSFSQVFEHRFQGLQLRNFDALAQQASLFTNVAPAGYLTEDVVPALLTGTPVDTIRATPNGRLLLHDPLTKAWRPFDEHDSVFQDASNARRHTAIAGWYNPYCRLLPTIPDQCSWSNGSPLSNGMSPSAGILSNMFAPLNLIAERGVLQRILQQFSTIAPASVHESDLHIVDLELTSRAADKVLLDPTANFVLLHYPVPHPPGIYSRVTRQMTDEKATYIDNLALADTILGHIRSTLERTGEWNDATIVLMGDHSWRTPMWRRDSDWSAEDERASSAGKFDTRPVYMIKRPGQHERELITSRFAALNTRKLIDALLSCRIRSDQDLKTWVTLGF